MKNACKLYLELEDEGNSNAENQKGKGVWQIKGLMRFIFVTDFILMVANLGIVVSYL